MIINTKGNGMSPLNTRLIHKNKGYTDTISIAQQLNTYFINVGCELAKKLPSYNYLSTKVEATVKLFSDRDDNMFVREFEEERVRKGKRSLKMMQRNMQPRWAQDKSSNALNLRFTTR